MAGQAVSEHERFHLDPERWQDIRAALFRQIEIAEDLARRLGMPELIELLANLDLDAHRHFKPQNCVARRNAPDQILTRETSSKHAENVFEAVAYVVLSFEEFLRAGNKLFAVP